MTGVSVSTSSGNITTLDTVPQSQLTTGEGQPGYLKVQDDYIHVTTGMLAANQGWRMCRIPTTAKVKAVKIYSDAALDSSSSQALALDINIALSDSTIDGTNQNIAGEIPTTANTGAVTPTTTYTSPNKLFGTVTQSGNNLAIGNSTTVASNGVIVPQPLDVTYNGQLLYNSLLTPETPLWELFGFTNSQGYAQDPGGFFDLFFVTSVAAATAHAANFYCRVEFVV